MSQLQTNMWDEFQGCDYIRKIMLLSH